MTPATDHEQTKRWAVSKLGGVAAAYPGANAVARAYLALDGGFSALEQQFDSQVDAITTLVAQRDALQAQLATARQALGAVHELCKSTHEQHEQSRPHIAPWGNYIDVGDILVHTEPALAALTPAASGPKEGPTPEGIERGRLAAGRAANKAAGLTPKGEAT